MGSAVPLRFTWTVRQLGTEVSHMMLCFTSMLEAQQDFGFLGILQEHVTHSYNSVT